MDVGTRLVTFVGTPDVIERQYNAWQEATGGEVTFAMPCIRGMTTGVGGQLVLFVFYRENEDGPRPKRSEGEV